MKKVVVLLSVLALLASCGQKATNEEANTVDPASNEEVVVEMTDVEVVENESAMEEEVVSEEVAEGDDAMEEVVSEENVNSEVAPE